MRLRRSEISFPRPGFDRRVLLVPQLDQLVARLFVILPVDDRADEDAQSVHYYRASAAAEFNNLVAELLDDWSTVPSTRLVAPETARSNSGL